MGRKGEASDHLQKFVDSREGRNDWKAFRILGDLFVDEFPRLAKGNYDKAAQLKAREPSVLLGSSTCAYHMGDHEEALRLAREAADADGRQTLRYVAHLARMLAARQQWAEADAVAVTALSLAEQAVRAQPGRREALETVETQYQLLIDLLKSRFGDGSSTVDDALRWAGYIRKRADIGQALSRHDSLKVLEQALSTAQANPPHALVEQYAVTLAEIGRTEAAIVEFERFLEMYPQNTTAPGWLERLRSDQR
jgi:tetratricopeptide (TPR) repeat protein